MERDKFLKLEKTIKQMNKTEPLGKDINDMSLEELEQLEQDLNDTEKFLEWNGGANELQKNIIESLRMKIKKQKK